MELLNIQEYYKNWRWVRYSSQLPIEEQVAEVKGFGAEIISFRANEQDECGNIIDFYPDIKIEELWN